MDAAIVPSTTPQAAEKSVTRRRNWPLVLVSMALTLFIAYLLLNRLALYPEPSFDEGAFLKVAKNFAMTGHYADFSFGENRYTGAIVSTGPTVILPIALLFKLFGPGLVIGRFVIVVYSALLLLFIFALSRSLGGRWLAFLAVIFVLALPGIGFDYLARSVFGEFPGLAFMFAALYLWLRPGKRSVVELIAIGILFGLAAMTKNQFAPIILGGLFLSWLIDLFWYRRNGPLHYIVPGVIAGLMYGGWAYYVLFLIGAHERDVAADLRLLRSATGSALILFNSSINNTNLNTLLQTNTLLFPALVVGLVLLLVKDDHEQRWGVLTIFTLIAAIMFVFSNGYERYEASTLIFGTLLIVRLLIKLLEGFHLNHQTIRTILRGKDLSKAVLVALVIIVLAADQYARPLYLQATYISVSGTNATAQVKQYLDSQVPPTAIISTYESMLGVLTNHRFRFASYSTVLDLTVKNLVGIAPDLNVYDRLLNSDAEYVILGPFSAALNYYTPDLMRQNYDLVFNANDYFIYRRKEATF